MEKESINTDFGKRLKTAFDGATNKEIAQRIGEKEGTVGFYVRGRIPSADILIKISKATQCSIDWLLTGEKKAVPPPELPFHFQLLEDRIREIVREEMAAASPVQDLGTVDDFLARQIESGYNPNTILVNWFERDGIDAGHLATSAFSGWDKMTLQEKIKELKAVRGIMKRQEERWKYVPPRQSE